MSRIIINNKTDMRDYYALEYVKCAVHQGKISGNHDEYCYHSGFSNGVHVFAKKTKSGTHTFTITKG